MAQQDTYFRNKLASERVSPNSLDTGSADLARAAAGMVDVVRESVFQVQQVNREQKMRAEGFQMTESFYNQYRVGVEKIKANNLNNPDKGFEEAQNFGQKLKDQYLQTIDDGGFRQDIGNVFDQQLAKFSIQNTEWQIKAQESNNQSTLLTGMQENVSFLYNNPDLENYTEKMMSLAAEQDTTNTTMGSVERGTEVSQNMGKAYTKAMALGLAQKGQTSMALKFLEMDSTAQILGEDLGKIRGTVEQAKKGQEIRYAHTLAKRAVKENQEYFADFGSLDIGSIEEKVTSIISNISDAEQRGDKASVTTGKKQLEYLNSMYEMKLNETLLTSIDDPQATVDLLFKFKDTFTKNKETGATTGAPDAVLDFQVELVRAARDGKISADTYQNFMGSVDQALVSFLQSKDVAPKFFGEGGPEDKELKFTGDSGLKRNDLGGGWFSGNSLGHGFDVFLQNFTAGDLEDPARSETIKDAFLFFMDDVKKKTSDYTVDLEPGTVEELANLAYRKANLKSMGLPIHLTVGSTINTAIGSLPITAFDEKGRPLTDRSVVDVPGSTPYTTNREAEFLGQ